MISCIPNRSCNPFSDPDVDVDENIRAMIQRCNVAKSTDLQPTDDECSESQIRYFLRVNHFDLESSMSQWVEWVTWRHSTF